MRSLKSTRKRGPRPKAKGRLGAAYIGRIEGLRNALRLTKPEFGKKLGVQPSVVSAWTKDKKAPSGRTLARLVNLAAAARRADDFEFFVRKLGIDEVASLYVASRRAEETVKPSKPGGGATLHIPVFTGGACSGRLYIDASFTEHHYSTVALVLKTPVPDSLFSAGDLLIIDRELGGSNLQALKGRMVLVEFAPPGDADSRPDWPTGLVIGTILIDRAGSATVEASGIEGALRDFDAGKARLEDVTTTWIASLASGAGAGCVIGVAESNGPQPQDFPPFDGCQILGGIVGWLKKAPETVGGR